MQHVDLFVLHLEHLRYDLVELLVDLVLRLIMSADVMELGEQIALLEVETFELEDLSALDQDLAGSTSTSTTCSTSCCSCSTSSCCSTTSSSCASTSSCA